MCDDVRGSTLKTKLVFNRLPRVHSQEVKSYLQQFMWMVGAFVIASTAEAQWFSVTHYALDALPRAASEYRETPCPKVDTTYYSGTFVRYEPEAIVYPELIHKMEITESIAAELGQSFYGRAPSHILLMGSYQCRKMRNDQRNISEHALGNALDIAGFIFPAIGPQSLPQGAPLELAQAQRITVVKHWKGTDPVSQIHQLFLQTWVQRLIDTPNLYRVILGPGYPGHHNHIHVDHAPYRLISVTMGERSVNALQPRL